jgi:RNA polymerase sigma factor (TIGR02999 family)
MTSDSRGTVTRLLDQVAAGDEGARNALIEHVYQQLHKIARGLMKGERRDHTWGPTDLVSEACVQLFKGPLPTKNRAYFYGAVAQAMRRLLIAHARGRHSPYVPLDAVPEVVDGMLKNLEKAQVTVEHLDEALRDLESFAQRAHGIVMLRFFGGLSVREVADLLDVSVSTVEKEWNRARSWLYTRLRERLT